MTKHANAFISLAWILFLVFIFSSCEKKEDETNPFEWKEFSLVCYEDKIIYNISSNDDKLMLLGDKQFMKVDFDDEVMWTDFYSAYDYNYKLPMNKEYAIMVDKNDPGGRMKVISLARGSALDASLLLSEVDPDFKGFKEIGSSQERNGIPYGAINKDNQLLMNYSSRDGDESFILVSLGNEKSESTIQDTSIIRLNDVEESAAFAVFPVNENYIVSNSYLAYPTTALIRPDGTTKLIEKEGFYPHAVFQYRGKHYAAGREKLFVSADDGETWSLLQDDIRIGHSILVMDDRLFSVGVHADLKEIRIMENEAYTIQLYGKGVYGNYCTAVTEFQGTVFISTLSGLFYKDKTRLFKKSDLNRHN